MTAVSPPKSKKDIKTAASEKLIENFERGIIRLSRVPIKSVKIKSVRNRQSTILKSRFQIAKAKQKKPRVIMASLKNAAILC